MKTAVVVPRFKAQSARKLLEEQGLWDKTRKLQKHDADSVAIPVKTTNVALLAHHLHQKESSILVIDADLPAAKAQMLVTPALQLLRTSRELLKRCSVLDTEIQRLLSEVPRHWEKHGDLVLLPANAFVSQEWHLLGQELWMAVAKCVGAARVARQAAVCADGYRSPQVELLLGGDGVVQRVDNGIRCEYDITRCMFSVGNITEKLRIASFNCRGETVVDLYAGIGYFTLPYLVHAHASHVHACEWNPHAVAALKRNLELNSVHQRCTVHYGDNRQLQLRGVADRVNLGLIPSSEEGWPVACRVLKPTGGVMHIHGNVNSQTSAGERLLGCPDAALAGSFGQVSLHDGESGENLCQDQSLERAETQGMQPGDTALSSLDVPQGRETGALATCGEKNVGVFPALSHPHTVPGAWSDAKDKPLAKPGENESKQLRNFGFVSGPMNETGEPSGPFSAGAESIQTSELFGNTGTDSSTNNSDEHSACPQSVSSKLVQTGNFLCDKNFSPRPKTEAWWKWGDCVCQTLKTLLEKELGGYWLTTVMHIEHVKSYAPHVHHVVLDIRCTPQPSSGQD